MREVILSFKNITFAYSERGGRVLDDINFEIIPQSITAILGPNGAGKTTLLHTALGWHRPDRGTVYLEGKPLDHYTRRELGSLMSLVPQSEHIPFEYSILEYVLLGRTPYLKPLEIPGEKDREIALEALETVGIKKLKDRSVTALSGGELQLVLIARSLAQQSKLLLLDEPSSHLDLSNKSRLLSLIRHVVDSGVTVLFTTHDPGLAAVAADKIILLSYGKIARFGSVSEVLTDDYLSEVYCIPLKVYQVDGQRVVLGYRQGATPNDNP